MNEEKCQRCGKIDEDWRMLWMACFYAMDELSIPFEQVEVYGPCCGQTGTKLITNLNIEVPVFEDPTGVERGEYRFFRLRVCKACRADWMSAIETWFNTSKEPEESCGSGIFIRELGITKEITEEEFHRRQKEKQ